MKHSVILFYFLVFPMFVFSQKDSLALGDKYSDDQIYVSVSYSQFMKQPSTVTKSNFSYSLSGGFMKDISLNKMGTIAIAAGFGYGFDFFNHKLKVNEVNGKTVFTLDNAISDNVFKAHNLEFPFEIRWRTSTAKKYNFWRIYSGIKFLYNLNNQFQYEDINAKQIKYSNVSAYNKLQYGLESVNTQILKFGLIFYFL
jgi:hypothetical protein